MIWKVAWNNTGNNVPWDLEKINFKVQINCAHTGKISSFQNLRGYLKQLLVQSFCPLITRMSGGFLLKALYSDVIWSLMTFVSLFCCSVSRLRNLSLQKQFDWTQNISHARHWVTNFPQQQASNSLLFRWWPKSQGVSMVPNWIS